MQLCGWQNNKTSEKLLPRPTAHELPLAFSGIHVVKKEILHFIPSHQKLSMTPLYLQLSENQVIKGYLHEDDTWMDIGKYDDLKDFNIQ